MEVWKDVVGYEGYYQVSSNGRLKSVDRVLVDGRHRKERILKPNVTRTGYYTYDLRKDRTGKRLLIHRLVAQAFIPNPENKREVNHINGIKADNRVSNLEWNTSSENQIHAFKNGLEIKASRKILQYDLNGNLVAEWNSAKEAASKTKTQTSNICHCCRGRLKSTGGYIWRYKEAKEAE